MCVCVFCCYFCLFLCVFFVCFLLIYFFIGGGGVQDWQASLELGCVNS